MIENRVSTLMGTRRIGITDLARETGIAYNTAYSLYRGTGRRVDFDTLNKLCRYFGVEVCDILVYVPDQDTGPEEAADIAGKVTGDGDA